VTTPPVCVPAVLGALFLKAATQLAFFATQLAFFEATTLQVQQERTQVICSNKVGRNHLAESNGTPAMHPGHMKF